LLINPGRILQELKKPGIRILSAPFVEASHAIPSQSQTTRL
jgi:hypothetical protein|tara:strand:+ start:560 stop:682 length:123 start_codon:yes stop_codon:yes gene_type:complete